MQVRENFCCIVVFFNPDIKKVEEDILYYKKNNIEVIYVDNFSENKDQIKNLNLNIIYLSENKGIAAAHNSGIDVAKKYGFDYVFILDQDTKINDESYFYKMLNSFKYIEESLDNNIIALGPLHQDEIERFNYGIISLDNIVVNSADWVGDYIPVPCIISSGGLLDVRKFDVVGPFREDYFIDYVDIEWGYRAKIMGYNSYIDNKIKITHNIGFKAIINGKNKNIHSSFRRYFMVRNSLYLFSERHVSYRYKVLNIYKQTIHSIYLIIFLKGQRMEYFFKAIKGYMDGFFYLFKRFF